MLALEIDEVKKCMAQLLKGELFDAFLFSGAVITTGQKYEIDGHIQRDFYTKEEQEQLFYDGQKFFFWKECKQICFEIIKGKRTPLSFQFQFQAPEAVVEELLQSSGCGLRTQDVSGLAFSLRYDGEHLHCVTAVTLNIFTMDKTLEKAWDSYMENFTVQYF